MYYLRICLTFLIKFFKYRVLVFFVKKDDIPSGS